MVIKGDRTWALEQQAHDLQPALSYRMLEHLTHRARVIVRGWQVDENAPREAWLIPLDSEQQRALPREGIVPISRTSLPSAGIPRASVMSEAIIATNRGQSHTCI